MVTFSSRAWKNKLTISEYSQAVEDYEYRSPIYLFMLNMTFQIMDFSSYQSEVGERGTGFQHSEYFQVDYRGTWHLCSL